MPFPHEQSLHEIITRVSVQLEAAQLYFGHGTDNAWDEACWLVETLFRRHAETSISAESVFPQAALPELEALLEQRITGRMPLAYLLREAWFAGLPFYVDERVLVPRSPLAELIANQFSPLLKKTPERILDLCCGSGCIGIAAALQYPQAQLCLSDLSADALAVAEININKHALEERVSTVSSDLFDNIQGKFDLILSNPPYVSEDEYRALPDEYLREPELALLTDAEGLDIPLKILRQAAEFMHEDACLILEVGNSWEALQKALPDMPFMWLDFEHGGHGVCALSKAQLQAIQA